MDLCPNKKTHFIWRKCQIRNYAGVKAGHWRLLGFAPQGEGDFWRTTTSTGSRSGWTGFLLWVLAESEHNTVSGGKWVSRGFGFI